MIICSCRRVTDRTIDAVVASGATSVDEVIAACGAGGRCGGCHPEIERIISSHVRIRTLVGTSSAA